MKVGILAHDFINWSGGIDFLGTVIDSLLVTPNAGQTEFHLLVPDQKRISLGRRAKDGLKQVFSKQAAVASAETGPRAFSEWEGHLALHRIEPGRGTLARAVKQLGLETVIPALHSLGRNFPQKWVGYAYDFQHKYYPQYFTEKDCRSRDEHFADLLTEARSVIVNSRAVAADIVKYVPQATAHVFALPFAPAPQPDWMEARPELLARHGINPPFFLISNQFWIHKDHATAFEAFRQVAGGHPSVSLVCTGSTSDPRRPEYFPGLMAQVKEWGLGRRVQVLGLIPKRDQIEIMKNACAVIQPTRFEGGPGGGAVYDAVAVDTPAIVSDLPVNEEIENPAVEFFPAGDAAGLAEKMRKWLAAGHVRASAEKLLALGRQRRAACGAELWRAIDFVYT